MQSLEKNNFKIYGNREIGADIKLSRIAKRLVPYQFEVKSQQKFRTLHKFFSQCERHGNLESVLVIKCYCLCILHSLSMQTGAGLEHREIKIKISRVFYTTP
mgnify:CR=1 FL=1|jgi:hypothetical protein